jgi:hypothetical protein
MVSISKMPLIEFSKKYNILIHTLSTTFIAMRECRIDQAYGRAKVDWAGDQIFSRNWIVALGHLYGVGQISQIEVAGVPTPKKVHEIAGRQQQTPGENLHR